MRPIVLTCAFGLPLGQVMDVAIEKTIHTQMVEGQGYPFTNCSSTINLDAPLCQVNCLRRVQAMKCCDQTPFAPIVKGKFSQRVNYTDPAGVKVEIENPVLACNVLKKGYRTCMAEQQQKFQDGEICLDGALSFGESFAFTPLFLNSKLNSYDDNTGLGDDGISDMEDKSLEITKHCVWSEDQGAGAEAYAGRLGKACKKDADCKSGIGGNQGACLEAQRAYCPPRCKNSAFRTASISASPISGSTASLVADRELAFRTRQQDIKKDNPAKKWWKPMCQPVAGQDPNAVEDPADPTTWLHTPVKYTAKVGVKQASTYTTCNQADVAASTALADADYCVSRLCMTKEEGEKRVMENYAVLNLDYLDFQAVTSGKEEAIPIVDLLGILGGNLGLFLGFSLITVLEWIEGFIFFALAVPWLLLRLNVMPWFVKDDSAEGDDPSELPYDEDVQQVMKNMKKIAKSRKEE